MMTFRRFAESSAFCNVELSPLIAATMDASQGIRPTTISNPVCRKHFGCTLSQLPDKPRRTVGARTGGRAGKTSYLDATGALYFGWTVPAPTLQRGESLYSLGVAPDLGLARQWLSFVLGYVEGSPKLSRAVIGTPTRNRIELRRPDGVRLCIQIAAASRGGRATRGRTLAFAALDEACFFYDETTGAVNDADIWRSVLQRVVPGGQVWVTSTPWLEDVGLLEGLIGKNFGSHSSALVVTGDTKSFNPSWDPDGEIERDMREQDPDAASREIDGLPIGGGAGQFLDPDEIRACVDDGLVPPVSVSRGGKTHFGADLAFSADSSALVGVAKVDGVLSVVVTTELRPKKGSPLRPKTVIDTFAATMRDYECKRFLADPHYKESAKEHLHPHGISFVDAPAGDQRGESYLHMKKIIHERRVALPNHPRFLSQLRSIIAKPTAGERWTYSIPRRRGAGHGDLASAFILALWAARGDTRSPEERQRELEWVRGVNANAPTWAEVRERRAEREADLGEYDIVNRRYRRR